jgi:hypothetical protein
LQDYFDDLAKYMKVGPPLYFVVKDFNYRYLYLKTALTISSKRRITMGADVHVIVAPKL